MRNIVAYCVFKNSINDNFTSSRLLRLLVLLQSIGIYGAPSAIRTRDPCLRRAVLYPAELWALKGTHHRQKQRIGKAQTARLLVLYSLLIL